MKKGIVTLTLLAICMSLVLPTFAAEDFVPSISYKDGPEIVGAETEDETNSETEEVVECLVITSLKGAEEQTTDIDQEDRDLLMEVYDKLTSGEMKLPAGDGFVIRELVDISWKQNDCVEAEHPHEEELNKEGVTVTIDLDMGLNVDSELLVYAYRDGAWEQIPDVIINGDGTITCVFEHFCPVAFSVRQEPGGSDTGDTAREGLVRYMVLMTLSMAAIAVLVIRRKKHMR